MNKQISKNTSIAYFKHWSRKNYAVFSSLNKTIKVCTLGLSCSLVAIPCKTKAQQADSIITSESLKLNEVVITAERTPALLSQTAKIVTVISKDDIAKQSCVSLEQALSSLSSVDIRQRGGLGVQSDISIRGGNFEQTLLLLNGANFNDPQTGHFNLNLPIDFGSIQRIEVLQGSAARSFGPNAMSGVVNIMFLPEKIKQIKISAIGGEFGYYNTGLQFNYFHKKFTHYLSVNRNSSNGYIKNTDFVSNNAYYYGTFSPKFGRFDYQAGINFRNYGANSFYTPKYPNQFETNKTTISSIRFENKGKIKIIPMVYFRHNTDRFELFRNFENAPSWYKSHNYHKTNVFGSNINSWYEWFLGKTSIGIDYRREEIASTVLGEELSTPISIATEKLKYTKGHTREILNSYIDHAIKYKNIGLSFGIMANYNNDLAIWNYFPGIDASYSFLPSWRVYASANSSMRMPTFTDLYYKSATLIGNTNLSPEQATTYEAGLKFFYPAIQGNITFFQRQGTNLIDWIKYPTDTMWRSENLTNINFNGVEIAANIKPNILCKRLYMIKNISLSYSFIEPNKLENGFESYYVLDQLKNKANFSIDIQIWKKLGINCRASYFDRYGSYTEYTNTFAGKIVKFKPYWLADSRLYWNNEKINVFVEAANIFNQKYFDIANVSQAGRCFRVGISYKFNIK